MFAAKQTLAFFPTYVWIFDLPEDKGRHLNETILARKVHERVTAAPCFAL